jgi:hydrogenase expression/formation protein HypD
VEMLVQRIEKHQPQVEIAYRRAVRPRGNIKALELMYQVFEFSAATWRGIGVIPESGLKIRPEFQEFDAEISFNLPQIETREPVGCICGEILRGLKLPAHCPLFQKACTQEHPVGPCMVSSEGACSAYNLYGKFDG